MFYAQMAAEVHTSVTHPPGVVLDADGNPVLDASGEPVFQEDQS